MYKQIVCYLETLFPNKPYKYLMDHHFLHQVF